MAALLLLYYTHISVCNLITFIKTNGILMRMRAISWFYCKKMKREKKNNRKTWSTIAYHMRAHTYTLTKIVHHNRIENCCLSRHLSAGCASPILSLSLAIHRHTHRPCGLPDGRNAYKVSMISHW